MEAFGRGLVAEPYLATVVIIKFMVAREETSGRQGWL